MVARGTYGSFAKIARPRVSRPAGKSDGHDRILRRFSDASTYVRGRKVRIEENGGFEGVTDGLDARGFLQIRTAKGLRTVLSGNRAGA